jgi:hypothetical protein
MDALPYFCLWVESVIRRMIGMHHGKAVAAPVKPGVSLRVLPPASNRRSG